MFYYLFGNAWHSGEGGAHSLLGIFSTILRAKERAKSIYDKGNIDWVHILDIRTLEIHTYQYKLAASPPYIRGITPKEWIVEQLILDK